ncbi:hypothetical protein [Escherichia coli]
MAATIVMAVLYFENHS